MKKAIVHLPFKIITSYASGSQIRPQRMIQALKSCGVEVDVIEGYGKQRKAQIRAIKQKVKEGVKYDFVYSESYNMPLLLSEKSHIPKYPLLEINFFRFCRKNKIKIGLFYRDIHWNFPHYRQNFGYWKYLFTYGFYVFDLLVYKRFVDVVYLPTLAMKKYLPIHIKAQFAALPPGHEGASSINKADEGRSPDGLHVLYVGGLGHLYQLDELMTAVEASPQVKLTICCREGEWKATHSRYQKWMNDRVRVVHKSGEDLEELYEWADVASVFVKPTSYWEIVMPLKLFEYIRFGKPILAIENTAVGNFVSKNKAGWALPYDSETLKTLFSDLVTNRSLLENTKTQIHQLQPLHTWKSRAEQVIADLAK